MEQIQKIVSDKLSLYRTKHTFLHYLIGDSVDVIIKATQWSKNNNLPFYCLGNGSNVLFAQSEIHSLIIKNNLPQIITHLGDNRYEISSSTSIAKVLKMCQGENRDSFYYLASVPATIGGALAMNAGRGIAHNQSIYDFVESVSFIKEGELLTLNKDQIKRSYRTTIFTGQSDMIITSAVFEFPVIDFEGQNKIKDRINFSKETQDHGIPNCGSVYKKSWPPIIRIMRIFGVHWKGAAFSKKTHNWISNKSPDPTGVLTLIEFCNFLHKILAKPFALEIVIIK